MKKRPVSLFTALVIGISSVGVPLAKAEDWPEFRGPQKNGHSAAKGLPIEWGPAKNVRWKMPLPGRAWSSPIVVGDRIYLTNAVGSGDSTNAQSAFSLRVLALSSTDGKVLWDVEVFKEEQPHSYGIHSKNSYASATPVHEDGRIYAHFGHFGTACLEAADGSLKWKTKEMAYKPVHGNGGCPVIVGDSLIFMADAAEAPFVAALDKDSGKVRWKEGRKSDARNTFSFSTPLVIDVKGQTQVVCVGSNVVTGLEPKTGKEIWRVRYDGYSVVPRPVYGHGLIFMSTGYNKASMLAIRPDGKGDVTDSHIVWKLTRGAPLTPSPLLIGDDLFLVADNGMVTRADAKTGNLYWQERVARQTSASPIYADGKIYIQDEQGAGFVVKAGPDFQLLGSSNLEDRSLASPAVSGKNLLIRTQSALWCLGVD